MAIAGLHNVPALESSMFRESQSSSSRRRGNPGSISTRASSILQMWRELEDECAVNRARERGRPSLYRGNDSSISPRGGVSRGGLEESSESENGSVINPESQVTHVNDHEDRQSLTSEQSVDLGEVERERVRKIFREWMSGNAETPRASSGQYVGDNEMERVRVVRNWVQNTSHPRGASVWSREEQVSENASQVENVRNAQVFNNNEGQPETSRRKIRKLCGRQALLDLLAKKEQERREELQCLEGTRPVSSFAHRNRIQSLLRLRSFQNRASTEVRRPTSPAESELGLLRRRQTVSGLREGFLSRLDNNTQVQPSGVSENDADPFRDDRSQANSADEVLDGMNEINDPSTEVLNVVQEENDPTNNIDVGPSTTTPNMDHFSDTNEGTYLQRLDTHDMDNSEESRPNTPTSVITDVSNVEIRFMNIQETTEVPDIDNELNVNGHESDVVGEEEQIYVEEPGSPFSNQWRDNQIETNRHRFAGDTEDNFSGALEIERGEQIDMQDDYWHENGSQETPRDWLGMASDSRLGSNMVDTYYFSDDDNVHHIELRELVNRRTVSSLLHSDFRVSLDHIVQSYVERQASIPDDWELHEMLPPPFMSRNQTQLFTDQDDSGSNGTRANDSGPTFAPPPPPPLPPAHWGQGLHQTNWARQQVRRRPGMDWDIINDLRMDMGRLQQRLNNMQNMLEACMDMQLELQRSVKQEVSAALSRSANQSESPENVLPKDSFKWDSARKGVCCICSNTNIDSLLYRCGHMCTCTKCAEILVQGNGKCPMCQAPVIEVIRAYFIQ